MIWILGWLLIGSLSLLILIDEGNSINYPPPRFGFWGILALVCLWPAWLVLLVCNVLYWEITGKELF